MEEQDKPYDSGSKRLLERFAQDFMDWLAPGAVYTGKRSEAFQSEAIDADIIHEAHRDGQLELVHVEIQSGPDANMEQRLLEYNVKAFRRYQCFVDSYVIFLRGGGGNLKPPLVRTRADGRRIGLMFFYEVILMREIPHEKLLVQAPKGIWPFIPFSKGGAQLAVVEQIITRLTPALDEDTKELLTLVFFFAELALPDQQDRTWLKRRKAMLDDFLRESSIYQDILAEGRQEGEKKGEARGKEEAKKERVLSLRGKILILVQTRFPQLKPLADQRIVLIEVPDPLEDLLLEIGMAQSVEEAQQYLQKVA